LNLGAGHTLECRGEKAIQALSRVALTHLDGDARCASWLNAGRESSAVVEAESPRRRWDATARNERCERSAYRMRSSGADGDAGVGHVEHRPVVSGDADLQKSMTSPEATRSIRLPIAPPRISPSSARRVR
jgi:hypothetical protein